MHQVMPIDMEKDLLEANRIPHVLVFLDSPMAIKVTEVFRRHHELFDEETKELLQNSKNPFDFPSLVTVDTTDHSKARSIGTNLRWCWMFQRRATTLHSALYL